MCEALSSTLHACGSLWFSQVRAFEDRCDLLRALIIGPSGTPYEGCPFVFDLQLPADFPASPPKVS
jgi:ubiquitin-conjugating enzyme E2 O